MLGSGRKSFAGPFLCGALLALFPQFHRPTMEEVPGLCFNASKQVMLQAQCLAGCLASSGRSPRPTAIGREVGRAESPASVNFKWASAALQLVVTAHSSKAIRTLLLFKDYGPLATLQLFGSLAHGSLSSSKRVGKSSSTSLREDDIVSIFHSRQGVCKGAKEEVTRLAGEFILLQRLPGEPTKRCAEPVCCILQDPAVM